MRLLDVNVLIRAHRQEVDRHKDYRVYVESLVNGDEAYAVSDVVISGFVRIVTNQCVWRPSTPLDEALRFGASVRNQPHAVVINPGDRFWGIFTRFCQQADVTSKLVTDAYLAALAMEHGCDFITTDRDFSRFPGLRWRHPLG